MMTPTVRKFSGSQHFLAASEAARPTPSSCGVQSVPGAGQVNALTRKVLLFASLEPRSAPSTVSSFKFILAAVMVSPVATAVPVGILILLHYVLRIAILGCTI